MDKTALLAPSSPGTAGHLQRAAPLREGNERGGERTRPFQQPPRGPSAESGGVEVRTPRGCSQIPAGAADSSPLEHPETARARDPAGPTHRLRRHAGHQAQGEQDPGAPHIPRGPAGSRRWQPERHEASCPAPGRSPRTGIRAKQLQRPPLGLGGVRLRLGSSGSGSGRSPPPPASAPQSSAAPGDAPPSHLLVSALPTPRGCCSGEAALRSSSGSAVLWLPRGLLLRVAAQLLFWGNQLGRLGMWLQLKFGGSAAGVCSARLELPEYLEGSAAERGEWLSGCAPPPRAPPPSGVLLLPSSVPSLLSSLPLPELAAPGSPGVWERGGGNVTPR